MVAVALGVVLSTDKSGQWDSEVTNIYTLKHGSQKFQSSERGRYKLAPVYMYAAFDKYDLYL